jgi:hypothetical protein
MPGSGRQAADHLVFRRALRGLLRSFSPQGVGGAGSGRHLRFAPVRCWSLRAIVCCRFAWWRPLCSRQLRRAALAQSLLLFYHLLDHLIYVDFIYQ